ncbi:MAG: ComEC/Rec2 family competence protein [Acutalibacteraceae bacterium]
MKRPLAVVGITMLVTMSVLCIADSPWLCVAVSIAVFVFAVIYFLLKRKNRSSFAEAVLIAIGASCLLVLSADFFIQNPALNSVSQRETVKLRIVDYPTEKNGRFYYIARLENADCAVKPLVRLSVSKSSEVTASLEPGDEISYMGRVYIISEKNESIHRYYKSRKILLGSYPLGEITLTQKGRHGIMYLVKNLRRRTQNLILKNFESETAGLVISVLLGDKSFVPDSVYGLFKTSGVAHIMAVSGLHLSIWILFVMRAVGFFGFDERKAASVLLGFTFIIMAFASFSGSVMRAGLMMLLYLVGCALGKSSDPLDSLGFSAIVVLIVNPYACMSLSFILSFASTLAIIVFALPLSSAVIEKVNRRISDGRLKNALEAVITCVFISLAVTLFTLPVTAPSFGSISVVGFVTNLLLLPVITPFVVCSGLFVIFGAVPVLSVALRLAVSFGAKYCLAVVKLLGGHDFSSYAFNADTVWLWIALSIVFFVLLYLAVKKKRKAVYFTAAVFFLISVPCAVMFDYNYEKTHYYVTVHDVSDGLAVTVSNRNKAAVIVGGCDSYYAGLIVGKLGDSFDSVKAVSIGSLDNSSALLNKLSADCIITTDNDLSALSPQKRNSVLNVESFKLSESCEIKAEEAKAVIEVNGLKIEVSAENETSCDLLITNSKSALDIPEKYAIIVSSEIEADGIYSTADYSDITLRINKNGKYTLKGENEWQYLMKSS